MMTRLTTMMCRPRIKSLLHPFLVLSIAAACCGDEIDEVGSPTNKPGVDVSSPASSMETVSAKPEPAPTALPKTTPTQGAKDTTSDSNSKVTLHPRGRAIGVYTSQLGALVPDNFTPVRRRELSDAINKQETQTQAIVETSLRRAQWFGVVHNGRIIGGVGRLEVQSINHSPDTEKLRVDLGMPSIALHLLKAPEQQSNEALTVDYIENKVAQVSLWPDQLRIADVAWRPTRYKSGRTKISLPEASVQRMWLLAEPNSTITCSNAIVRTVALAPTTPLFESQAWQSLVEKMPEASRWFLVETGGGYPLDLTVKRNGLKSNQPCLVRDCRWQFEFENEILRWECRLTLQPDQRSDLAELELIDAALDRVQIDGIDCDFDTRQLSSRKISVRVRPTATFTAASNPQASPATVTLTLRGTNRINDQALSGTALPMLDWDRSQFVVVPQRWQSRLTVVAQKSLKHWRLPPGWQLDEVIDAQQWTASGPPIMPDTESLWRAATCDPIVDSASSNWLRLEIKDQQILGKARIEIPMSPRRIKPIRLEVQTGFVPRQITMGGTKREIDPVLVRNPKRALILWPHADEIIGDRCVIELTADFRVSGRERNIQNGIRSLWMTRPIDYPSHLVAAIIPPAELSWTSKTAISPSRIGIESLSDNQRLFFAPLPGDSIVFGRTILETPLLQLKKPNTDFNVQSKTRLSIQGGVLFRDSELRWDNASTSRTDMRVQIPQSRGNDELKTSSPPTSTRRWFVQLAPSSPLTDITSEVEVLSSEAVNVADNFNDVPVSEFKVTMPAGFGVESSLIMREQLPAASRWSVGLPQVIGARLQETEVWLTDQISFSNEYPELDGLPPVAFNDEAIDATRESIPSRQDGIGPRRTPSSIDIGQGNRSWRRWRDRNNRTTEIDVQVRSNHVAKTLVIDQQLDLVASVSGLNRIKGTFLIQAADRVDLLFPNAYQLESISCDGIPCEHQLLAGRGARINRARRAIDAKSRSDAAVEKPVRVDASWSIRSPNTLTASSTPWFTLLGSGPFRKIETPKISVLGTTMTSRVTCSAANDSQIILAWNGSSAWIVSTSWWLGLGWVASIVIFVTTGWLLRSRATTESNPQRTLPAGFVIAVVITIAALLLWPETLVPLLCFVLLPLCLSGLTWTIQNQTTKSHRFGSPDSIEPDRLASSSFASAFEVSPIGNDSGNSKFNGARDRSGNAGRDRPAQSNNDSASTIARSRKWSLSKPKDDFSSSAFRLIGWIVFASCPVTPLVAEPAGATPSASAQFDVLVPVEQNGKPLGDKVYIPNTIYEQLFLTDSAQTPQPARVAAAAYRIEVTGPTASPNNVPIVETAFSATLTMAASCERISLPLDAATIREITTVSNGVLTRCPFVDAENGSTPTLIVTIPKSDAITLSIRMTGQLQPLEKTWRYVLNVPPVHIASAAWHTDPNVRLLTVQGEPVATAPSHWVEPLLGPVDTLTFDFLLEDQPKPSAVTSFDDEIAEQSWRRLDWIHLHSGSDDKSRKTYSKHDLIFECELQPDKAMLRGSVVEITWSSLPTTVSGTNAYKTNEQRDLDNKWLILGQSWSILDAESDRVTVEKQLEDDQPIRLLRSWTISHESDSAQPFWRPPVARLRTSPHRDTLTISTSHPKIDRHWFAWTSVGRGNVTWQSTAPTTSVTDESFFNRWTGTLGRLDQAIERSNPDQADRSDYGLIWLPDDEALDQLKRRDAASQPMSRSVVTSSHHVDCGRAMHRIRFTLRVPATETTSGTETISLGQSSQYRIDVPADAQLINWSIFPSVARPIRDAVTKRDADTAFPDRDRRQASQMMSLDCEPMQLVRSQTSSFFLLSSDRRGRTIDIEAVVKNDRKNSMLLPLFRYASVAAGPRKSGVSQVENVSDIEEPLQIVPEDFAHELIVTRASDAKVTWVESPLAKVSNVTNRTAELLAEERLLVGRWTSRSSETPPWLDANLQLDTTVPRLRCQPKTIQYSGQAKITLQWQDGRWTMRADLKIDAKSPPDFIDIEIPTPWCDDVQIEPLLASSQQPTMDPARKVLRIALLPPNESSGSSVSELSILSTLADVDMARVSAPSIRWLGASETTIDVVVPKQLINEPIRWRSRGASRVAKSRWRDTLSDSKDTIAAKTQPTQNESSPESSDSIVFAVTNNAWSIELLPLPVRVGKSTTIHADHQVWIGNASGRSSSVFRTMSSQHPSNLVFVRSQYLYLPGDASSITLSMPDGLELLGIWCGSEPADIMSQSTSNLSGYRNVTLRVPFRRLAQSLVVLAEHNASANEHKPSNHAWRLNLPRLQKMPAETSTIELVCDTRALSLRSRSLSPENSPLCSDVQPDDRARVIANSITKAIEASADTLAERRDDEVAWWLRDWFRLYANGVAVVGRSPPWAEEIDESAAETPQSDDQQTDRTWLEMNSKMKALMDRYPITVQQIAANPIEGSLSAPPTMKLSPPMRPWRTLRADGEIASVPLPLIQTKSSRVPDATTATRGMALMMTCLCLIVLWPRRRTISPRVSSWLQWLSSPASWLFLLGLIAFPLVPWSIAFALMATAVILGGFESIWRWITGRARTVLRP